ncbi:hypothetical protein LRP31_25710 [Mesorhizobium mediterraneum]|uniref:Cytochrome n=1 Tax=Mesorhizobium mediterraneum TaxID=43617 RepID=A0AB36RGN6_9HYPH|nr:hypothetical protein [Mesorhizobium mediterraneum]PAQ03683.1 hypothetical protein CIT25_03980 [Mesorhizobium mediterraneum]WIW52420.1 hypothetical protein LRP31_25710 [Mesorhizobium mediterraneum]
MTEEATPLPETVQWLRYRPLKYDDWGIIRHGDSDHIFAVVRRPLSEEEAAVHRHAGTDPFEQLARALMDAASPPKPQEGVVEALREALTNMKAAFDGLRPMPLVMEPIAKRLSDDAAAALALAGDQP